MNKKSTPHQENTPDSEENLLQMFRLYFQLQSQQHMASPEEGKVIRKHIKELQLSLLKNNWNDSLLEKI